MQGFLASPFYFEEPSSTPSGTVLTGSGALSFTASPDHATVTSYEVRLLDYATLAQVSSLNIGKPIPVSGVCYYDLASWLGTFAAGNYYLTVAAIAPGGTTVSGVSNAFSLPL